ncbi:molecular chaperone Hsp33 [Limimaricola variabilis]|uniref:Molecular chaperone Hsp33 n=1 Tax=Limimaricola variabilis TaxID=1492771 RepID=A0ABR6HLX8_9RHOB|nr:Hsp33 family molecular chaperone HslO [Limimaricola variabilis]MBB3711374.1 molecular chaperone Hsp33 [Limimaricola variabilis]
MSLGARIAWDDTVLPFQLDRSDIRGRVARLDGVLDKVLEQHDYPKQIEALVAEMALLTALIGQTVKLRWKLSLQVRGDGPARLIATDYYAPEHEGAPARIRAWASFDESRLDETADPYSLIGKGYFAILIDQGQGNTPYQGITPITGESLAACAETYFAQSEQLPTRFSLSFGRSTEPGRDESWRAGGVMLQKMPKASPFAAKAEGGSGEEGLLEATDILDENEGENWSRANILLDTVEEMELIGPSVAPTDLLLRLFHEEEPRVFDPQPVQFGCTCSEAKVRQSLSIYSAKDIAHMTTEEGIVTADCQFCGAHYEFAPQTLGFEATEGPDAKPADESGATAGKAAGGRG